MQIGHMKSFAWIRRFVSSSSRFIRSSSSVRLRVRTMAWSRSVVNLVIWALDVKGCWFGRSILLESLGSFSQTGDFLGYRLKSVSRMKRVAFRFATPTDDSHGDVVSMFVSEIASFIIIRYCLLPFMPGCDSVMNCGSSNRRAWTKLFSRYTELWWSRLVKPGWRCIHMLNYC